MTFDATFWVMISFFGFVGLLIFFQVPQKIKSVLEENITNIKNQIDEADKLKEDAKNILTENEKKISSSKAEVKHMLSKASEEAEKNVIKVIRSPASPKKKKSFAERHATSMIKCALFAHQVKSLGWNVSQLWLHSILAIRCFFSIQACRSTIRKKPH